MRSAFKTALAAFVLCGALCAAAAQEYGLVLAGGGGKGAYQVGVWKALKEYGLAQKVTVMSGTSVGGLNAALFACLSAEEAEELWLTQVPTKLQTEDALISQQGLQDLMDELPLSRVRGLVSPQIVVTAVRERLKLLKLFTASPGSYAHRFVLNTEEDVTEIGMELLATSAFPVICDAVLLKDGYFYTDGGEEKAGGDNVPIDPIVELYPQVSSIIVVYLSDRNHVGRRVQKKNYDSKDVWEVFPSIDIDGNGFLEGLLDGTTNFTAARIRLLIQQGYEDMADMLRKKGFRPVLPYWFEG